MVVIARHSKLLEQSRLDSLGGVKKFEGDLVKSHGKKDRRRDIFQISARDESGQPVILFLKRNWKPYKKDGLASLITKGKVRSQSRREWENSRALQNAGFETCGLVAMAKNARYFGKSSRS